MTKLLVGCPVSSRNWILDYWFEHVEVAASKIGIVPEYQFVAGSEDYETIDFLSSKERVSIRVVAEPKREDVRQWGKTRFEHMVILRNQLLDSVREREPDFFLSLDSDILLAEESIRSAMSGFHFFKEAAAVGMKCYMTEHGVSHPSMGIWTNPNSPSTYYRKDYNYCAPCHIIMAAKLMKSSAYNIDYQWHQLGEDLGWSLAVMNAGLQVLFDGRVANKHVMAPEFLDVVDPRCGF